jgi:hypothetical protein
MCEVQTQQRLRSTKRQLEALVAFVEKNKELAEYKKRSPYEARIVESKWINLKTILNDLEGPNRTVKEWKQVF